MTIRREDSDLGRHGPLRAQPLYRRPSTKLADGVWHECRKARGRNLRNRASISNLSGVVSLAMDIFKHGQIGVLPTDKDGGYCLIPKQTLQKA